MESNNLIVVTFSEANLDVTPANKAPDAVVTTLPNLDAPFFNMLPLLIAVAVPIAAVSAAVPDNAVSYCSALALFSLVYSSM